MLRKIVFILALLCLLAVSNSAMAYNWSPNTTWHGGQGSSDWFDGINWWVSDIDPNTAPDINYQALIEPKGPRPQIDGAATVGYLNIMPWSWPGAGNFGVDMNSGTLDCNYGISIGAWGVFDSASSGIPDFTMRGGTVTVLTTPGDGVLVGGGGSGAVDLEGALYMYGGTVQSDRVELRYGTIHLYGGTLDCNLIGGFAFYQDRPTNKIDISGGTLKVRGNYTTNLYDPNFLALIRNGRIYSARGNIGVPVFDGTFTTVTSSSNDLTKAFNPSPEANATNVHYRVADVNVGVMLGWDAGEPNVVAHNVYFGTNANIVNSVYGDANYKVTRWDANGDPRTWGLDDVNWPAGFKINISYYWRIDEVWLSDDVNTSVTKGRVWTFKTHDGKAYNPNPINGAAALSEPLQLRWTAGDFAASHLVYVGTAAADVLNATSTTAKVYRGIQTGTSYSIANLVGAGWFGPLVPGTPYFWKITEINNTTQWNTGLGGTVWSFTPAAYVTVDDFEDYNNTADLQASWDTVYATTCGETSQNGTIGLVRTITGKYMSVHYSNISANENRFTEIRRFYKNGTTFTGSGALLSALAALRVDYLGSPINAADPTYDRMYVALQDTAGNIGVFLNPDASATLAETWQQWYVGLKDINDIAHSTPGVTKLTDVNAFMLGFGVRCAFSGTGGDGNVMFDNIRLYSQTCNPAFGPAADLDGDCDVDINDLDLLANEWLYHAELRTFVSITAPAAPVLWYKFNDSGNTQDVLDYSGNNYTGTVKNWNKINWNPTGSRTGGPCIYLPDIPPHNAMSYIDAPVGAFDGNGFMGNVAHSVANGGGGVSFSIWINASFPGDFYTQWGGIFGAWSNVGEYIEIPLPSRVGPGYSGTNGSMSFMKHIHTPVNWTSAGAGAGNLPLLDFGGRWNHWAFVKTASNDLGPYGSLKVYKNGTLLAQTDANGQTGDPNVAATGPLWDVVTEGVTRFKIGTRGDNWAMWAGKLSDFKVFDYALSDAEIAYIASDGTGSLLLPLSTKSNLVTTGAVQDQVINFADLAEMCTEWRTTILWP